MSQFSYVPGDSRLVDHIIGELKSKGIFDQFRKECIADVDTRPAYQNLRLRVEGSVSGYLSRTKWRPELNKNQLRESLRKHIIEANYLEQGVERIVDQVVNPKVASVFIPQVEDLVYSYLGIQRPKSTQVAKNEYSSPNNDEDHEVLLPTDLDVVSPGSMKSQETLKDDKMEVSEEEKLINKMDIVLNDTKSEKDDEESPAFEPIKANNENISDFSITTNAAHESNNTESNLIKEKEPKEDITVELSNMSIDIPLPEEKGKVESESVDFKQSDIESSSDSTMMRNVSPLTPIRSFNNENSCDAQPPFDERKNETTDEKTLETNPIPISTFRFTIETEATEKEDGNPNKLISVERSISYQYTDQMVNYSGPSYDDSSSSNNLHIDYQSDKDAGIVDSKTGDTKVEVITDEIKNKDQDEKRKSHKSSHSSKERHSSSRHSKDRRSDSKHHSSDKKDPRGEKKSIKDDSTTKSRHSSHSDKSKDKNDKDKSKEGNEKEKSKELLEKKEKERSDSSKDRYSSSQKISSNSNKDSKSKHSSSSSRRHSSSSTKHADEKKSSRRNEDKKDNKDHRGSSRSSKDYTKHSSSRHSEKDKSKSSSSKDKYDKENKKDDKKEKKITDDHYSASGRGNRTRRSTDRDSNDGNSSSSKGSTVTAVVKQATTTVDNKSSSSKSENQTSSDSNGQSDAVEHSENIITVNDCTEANKLKPVLQLEGQLKTPVEEAPKLPSVEKVSVKKPMIAANMTEAIKLMKVRRVLAAEQEKKRQEAVLLLEFQEKIHSSISQVFSGISGPELEFACSPKDVSTTLTNTINNVIMDINPSEHAAEINVPANNINEAGHIEDNESKSDNTTHIRIIIETGDDEIENKRNTEETTDDDYLNFMYGDPTKEMDLHYFSQKEISQSELESDTLKKLLYPLESSDCTKKLFLLNCDSYEEEIMKQACQKMGNYQIINFVRDKVPKCGPSKLNTNDLAASSEFILSAGVTVNQPTEREAEVMCSEDSMSNSYVFGANISSDCSLDMTVEYEKKIDEMMMKTSRQQVMEIILGGAIADSPTKMPKIVFGDDSMEKKEPKVNLKRKNGVIDVDEAGNNNHKVLMPNKMRKSSLTDVITSTTDMSREDGSGTTDNFKSKLTGKARRVGLAKPKNANTIVPMSPTNDKSVENYVQNSENEKTSPKLNGVLARQTAPSAKRMKVQRYDTSDLYKPKLQYISKRHSNVT